MGSKLVKNNIHILIEPNFYFPGSKIIEINYL